MTVEWTKSNTDDQLCNILSTPTFPLRYWWTDKEVYNVYKEICSRNLVCTNESQEYRDEIANVCKLGIDIDEDAKKAYYNMVQKQKKIFSNNSTRINKRKEEK